MPETSFEYKGVQYFHNDRRWEVKTNRHPTTSGFRWGWIEGCPGEPCWSNEYGKPFNEKDACDVANIHNQWRIDQEPIDLKLFKANENLECAQRDFDAAEVRMLDAEQSLVEAKTEVERLEAMQAKELLS